MKTAVIYMSKHGTTRHVANLIRCELGEEACRVISLRENKLPDITEYDRIIIGGSIHAGRIQKRITDFCNQKKGEMLDKDLGLFICGMEENQMKEQFENAFPYELREHARYSVLPGGEFRFEKMNFLEKAIVKKIAGVKASISNLDENRIREFAQNMTKN